MSLLITEAFRDNEAFGDNEAFVHKFLIRFPLLFTLAMCHFQFQFVAANDTFFLQKLNKFNNKSFESHQVPEKQGFLYNAKL